jgi:hypothetical protein
MAGVVLCLGAVGIYAPRVGADSASGCDFAPNGSTASCTSSLSGSTFAGGDGNLSASPSTYGTTDWQNVAGMSSGLDLASGSGDNAFGQGSKEDDPAVSVVTGSIPPNKSDLSRFYEASQNIAGQTFLYLAWERSNVLGNANMDFEIDQQATPTLTSSFTGSVTLNRQPGDMLITYDFTNGGGTPVLGLNRWLVSATSPSVPGFATNVCLSANSFPCWGDHKTLNGASSQGAVNNLGVVTDPIAPNAPRSLPASTFGEAAINLTEAGVFGTNTCSTFATTFLKSRSSSSFTSEVKDFVAPVPTTISNCGEVKIVKHTDPAGIDQNFSFSSTLAGSQISCTSPTSFTLNDKAAATSTLDCKNVPIGNYTVTETQAAGFALESLTCTTGGSQNATKPLQADIAVSANSVVTCTYVNQQQLGAIKITKTSVKASGTPLAGATFTVKNASGTAITGSPFTTGSNGTFCVDHLGYGTYSVTETGAPSGYAIDDTSAKSVVVSQNSTCGDGKEATRTFTDTPLTDVIASATSEASGGTKSTVSCVDGANAAIGNSPQGLAETAQVTANGLKPGTYTCTIVIDP